MFTFLLDPKPSAVKGIFWMAVSATCFVGVGVLVRWVGNDLPAPQAAFIRYLIGLLLFAPVLISLWRAPSGTLVGVSGFWWRGLIHIFGVMLWFYAMAHIPIAEVTAIGYTAPLYVTIGAVIFLGERIRARRVIALLAGILGGLIILRPGFQELNWGQLAQLLAAPLFAISTLMGKHSTKGNSSLHILAMLTLTCTVFLAPPAILFWVMPSLNDYIGLALTAIVATAGHFSMTAAFRAAPVTVTQPVNVLQLVLATLVGILIWSDPLDFYIIIGGVIVVLSVSYITYREHHKAGRE